MMKQLPALAILPLAFAAHAACAPDPPEIGDIGPSSELVCSALERQFPGAALTVLGRSIHSPTEVSVAASVDGRPVALRYKLSRYTWRLETSARRIAAVPHPAGDVAPHK
jgi:hypothetical protein